MTKMDELFVMLEKFQGKRGTMPTKIVCGETAFKEILHECNERFEAYRYIEPTDRRDCQAQFMGIPIQIIRSQDPAEDVTIYLTDELQFEYEPNTWDWLRRPLYRDLTTMATEFERHYLGDWTYTTTTNAVYKKPDEECDDISDEALMSVLNGGGFTAVA